MVYLFFKRLFLCLCGVVSGLCLTVFLIYRNAPQAYAHKQPQLSCAISLPMIVPNTDLVAEFLGEYEGDFFEDGSDIFVMDTAMLLLHNAGQRHIDFAKVEMTIGQSVYHFEATCIPAGANVWVLERNRMPCPQGDIAHIQGIALYGNAYDVTDDILVQTLDMGHISVTNQTQEQLVNICFFYKKYLQEDNHYLGGITYVTTLAQLQPGQTHVLSPANYAKGYSKVLYITAGRKTPDIAT